MEIDDEINDLNNDFFPNNFNYISFYQEDFIGNEENINNSFEYTNKDITKRNNDFNVQTQNSSKKLDNIIIAKKENNSLTKKESNNTKSIRFMTRKTRRTKNQNEIKHKFDAFDNLTDRTQTNFNNFLISFANDISNISFGNDLPKNYFKKLDYNESKALNEIKDKRFKDIFTLKISRKNKGIGNLDYENVKYINKNIYDNIVKISPLLEEFFDKSYLDLFENYYYKNIREFDFKGIHFKLSENTKIYKDLLKKGKNSSVEYKFENVINKKYLNIYKK